MGCLFFGIPEKNQRACSSTKLALAMVYLLVGIQGIDGILIEKPVNTVTRLNEETTLNCKSDHNRKLLWHTSGNNSELDELWSGYFVNPKACPSSCCQIDNGEPGKYNLNIIARKETAKLYICTEPGTLMRASADLTVIASELDCTEDETSLSCSIVVYGKWLPQIKWNNSDGQQMNDVSLSVERGKVVSTFTMPPTSEEGHYTASVYFSETGRPTEVTASNIPTYRKEWKSSSFKAAEAKDSPHNVTAIVVITCCAVAGVISAAAAILLSRKKETKNLKNDDEKKTCVYHPEKKSDEGSLQEEGNKCEKINGRMLEVCLIIDTERDPATNVTT